MEGGARAVLYRRRDTKDRASGKPSIPAIRVLGMGIPLK